MTIPIVFFALFVLTLWFVIGSKGHWALKAAVIATTLHLCVSVGISLDSFAGWPSSDRLPDKFLIHWMVVKEPSKKTKEPGAIYVWLTSMTDPKSDTPSKWRRFFIMLSPDSKRKPRAHVVPYSKGKHEEADGIVQLLKDGRAVVGERGKGEGEGDGDGESVRGNGDNNEDGANGGGSFSISDGITFHELPPTRLPKKAAR